MIKAIIVDDEAHWTTMLFTLITDNCPEIEVLATCNTATDALHAIQLHKPQLLLLDIEMPEINAFELLDKIGKNDFELILMSDHDVSNRPTHPLHC